MASIGEGVELEPLRAAGGDVEWRSGRGKPFLQVFILHTCPRARKAQVRTNSCSY